MSLPYQPYGVSVCELVSRHHYRTVSEQGREIRVNLLVEVRVEEVVALTNSYIRLGMIVGGPAEPGKNYCIVFLS